MKFMANNMHQNLNCKINFQGFNKSENLWDWD